MPYTLFDLLFQPKLNPAYGASEPSHVSDTFTGDPTEAMKKYGTTNIYQQPSFFQKLIAPQISGEIMAANREAALEPIKQASQLSFADRLRRAAHDYQFSVAPTDAAQATELELKRREAEHNQTQKFAIEQAKTYIASATGVHPNDVSDDEAIGFVAMHGAGVPVNPGTVGQTFRERANLKAGVPAIMSEGDVNLAKIRAGESGGTLTRMPTTEAAKGMAAVNDLNTEIDVRRPTIAQQGSRASFLLGRESQEQSLLAGQQDLATGELERGKAIQGKRKSLLDTELEAMGGEMAQRWQSAFNPMWASQGASVLPKVPMFDKLSGELQNTDNPSYQSPMARQLQQAQELQGTQAGAPVVKPSNGPAVRLKPKAKKSGLGAPYKVVGEAVGDDATVEEPVKKPTTPVPQAVKKTPTPTTPANTVKLRLKNGQVIDLPVAQTADLGDIPWKKAGVTMLDYLDALLTNKPLPAYR